MASEPQLFLGSGETAPVCGQFKVRIDFGQSINPADLSGIEPFFFVDNGSFANNWNLASDDLTVWELDVLPTSGNDVSVTVQLLAGAYQDGLGETNLASNILTVPHNGTAPRPSITGPALDVTQTSKDLDVAILLDRSGSMLGDRWQAAYEGAQLFAQLVADIGLPSAHNVGIYWFHGNCADRTSDHTVSGAFTGSFPLGGSDSSVGSFQVLTHTDDIDDTCTANGPTGCTAVGAGLVMCKDELASLGNEGREKVILALSDGMENCHPLLSAVFPAAGTSAYWADGAGVRIHAAAVLTQPSWVSTFRNAVEKIGGVGTVDHIATSTADPGTLIRRWFVSSFKQLFGLVAANEEPELSMKGGDVAFHPVRTHLGADRIYFYIMYEDNDDGDWLFGVIPPGEDRAIYTENAASYPGIRCLSGRRHQVLSCDLPLCIAGHEHRWAGEWKMVVARERGADERHYAVGAFARQDIEAWAEIRAPRSPLPGDKARIVVSVRDQQDRPISEAVVSALIHTPGQWTGHQVSVAIASDPALLKKVRRSKSKAAKDTEETADRVLQALYAEGRIQGGTSRRVLLKESVKGVYTAEIRLANPGDHHFDISVSGTRIATAKEIDLKIGPALKRLSQHYSKTRAAEEKRFFKRAAGRAQRFELELKRQLAVGFLPSAVKTETQGYFVNESGVCLRVQPRDKSGALLGPGWKACIQFQAPGVELGFDAEDLGDSTYQVNILVDADGARLDRRRNTLMASCLFLVTPERGPIEVIDKELPLKGFGVTVLGVTCPVTVLALVGNKNTREVHLATCSRAARIKESHKLFFHNLREVKKHGFDTCEWCLPLICNTNPKQMEAHKPSCDRVKRIAPKNRLEVSSMTEAMKLGMGGCAVCLKHHHTR